MFTNENNKKPRKGATISDHGVTIITSGCSFNGKLYCRGSSRIAGSIEGEIVSEGNLIIEDEAVINANINADEVILHGKVTGAVNAKKRIELTETAEFSGDISTPSIIIKEGALFNGTATMTTHTSANATNVKKLKNENHANA